MSYLLKKNEIKIEFIMKIQWKIAMNIAISLCMLSLTVKQIIRENMMTSFI